jgi:hypothetical protein
MFVYFPRRPEFVPANGGRADRIEKWRKREKLFRRAIVSQLMGRRHCQWQQASILASWLPRADNASGNAYPILPPSDAGRRGVSLDYCACGEAVRPCRRAQSIGGTDDSSLREAPGRVRVLSLPPHPPDPWLLV